MENLTSIVINFGVAFFIMLILPEWQKSTATVREAIKSIFKKPFESFTVVSLVIILAGVIKTAFLQG